MHRNITSPLVVIAALAVVGCGPSERELELQRQLARRKAKQEALESRLKRIGELEQLVGKMSDRQDELETQLGQARTSAEQLNAEKEKLAEKLKKQLVTRSYRGAVQTTARRPTRVQPTARVSLLDHLAGKVQLAPGQKERVGELLKQGLEQLREVWLACKDADAPPEVLDVLQRENRAEVARQISELLDEGQRGRFAAWQAERKRATVPQQPLQLPPMTELVKPAKATAAAQREAKLQQFAERNGLTELQVERLKAAEAQEREATRGLWADRDLSAQSARAALDRRREIRQQLAATLEQSLTKPQLDAYVAWRETLVMPQQAATRTGWWRTTAGAVDDL